MHLPPLTNRAGAVNISCKANLHSLRSSSVACPFLLSFGPSLTSILVSQRANPVTATSVSPKHPCGPSVTIKLLLSIYLPGLECMSLPDTSEELRKYFDCRDFTNEVAANRCLQYVGVHTGSRVQCRERHPRCPAEWGCKEPDPLNHLRQDGSTVLGNSSPQAFLAILLNPKVPERNQR